jgi:hypothetical protein
LARLGAILSGKQKQMDVPLEQLTQLAQAGNREALERLVEQIQNKVYGLALRMLWGPEDACDATQVISSCKYFGAKEYGVQHPGRGS